MFLCRNLCIATISFERPAALLTLLFAEQAGRSAMAHATKTRHEQTRPAELINAYVGINTSQCMQVAAYRNGSTYQLWQIHTLAKEPDCQKSLLEEDAISTLVPLLADEQLAVGSASILQRLATMDGADRVMQAGKHICLGSMLEEDSAGSHR